MVDYEIKYTKYSRHAIKIAKKCHNCRIYAVGGDGLIHEIVQGIEIEKSLLYI